MSISQHSAARRTSRVPQRFIACWLGTLIGCAQAANAQVTQIQGLAFVPSPVISGTTTTVLPTSAAAAVFRIRGILGLNGGFSFNLPTVLARVGGGGTMPITFCSTCGMYRLNNPAPGGTVFNPATGVSGLGIVVLTEIYVFLGASISPPRAQRPGTYVGTIVITSSPLL